MLLEWTVRYIRPFFGGSFITLLSIRSNPGAFLSLSVVTALRISFGATHLRGRYSWKSWSNILWMSDSSAFANSIFGANSITNVSITIFNRRGRNSRSSNIYNSFHREYLRALVGESDSMLVLFVSSSASTITYFKECPLGH